jgi:hypothetical protein
MSAQQNGQFSLPDLTADYVSFSQWHLEQLQGENKEGEKLWSFWQEQLSGYLPQPTISSDPIRSVAFRSFCFEHPVSYALFSPLFALIQNGLV